MGLSGLRSWPAGLSGVDAEQFQELGLEVSGFGDGGCLSPGRGDEAEFAECLEDEPSGGFAGPAVVDVKADHLGGGGEVAPDCALGEAEDQQGEADDGDQGGDPTVVA